MQTRYLRRNERFYPARQPATRRGEIFDRWGVWDAAEKEWATPPNTTLNVATRECREKIREQFPGYTFVSYREFDLFAEWARRDKKTALARKLRRGTITRAGIAVMLTPSERATVERYQGLGEARRA
jgi:hypothetical protein